MVFVVLLYLCYPHLKRVASCDFLKHARDLELMRAVPAVPNLKTYCSDHVLFGESVVQDWAFGSSLAIRKPREETLEIAHSTIRYPEQCWCYR